MCKNPLKRKVASQFLNVLAQFLTHYQHFCKKKKKKVMRPKSEEGGDEKQLCFLCGLKMLENQSCCLGAMHQRVMAFLCLRNAPRLNKKKRNLFWKRK